MANYNSDYYEGNAQSGDRPALSFYYRLFRNELGRANRKNKATILEFGCGVGHLTKRLSNDYDCYALDISSYALQQVNKNAPRARTIKSMSSIKNESLDGVIALHVLEHIKNPKVTLDGFYSKLKPGGLLVYVVPNPDGLGHKIKKGKWFGYRDSTHVSMFEETKWSKLTEKSKFKITKIRGDGMWDVPYLPLLPVALQKLIFFPPAAVQFAAARVFLPTKLGECLIFVAKKQ